MLQDLAFGRLENEFQNLAACAQDCILCFHEGQVLLSRDAEDVLTLPALSWVKDWEQAGIPPLLSRRQPELMPSFEPT